MKWSTSYVSNVRFQGKLPDFSEPVILRKRRISVQDFCRRIHKR